MSHEDTTTRRVLAGLGQQSAPPSLYGHGRRVLYRCPTCQYPWFMDGPQTWLRPTSEELVPLAQELGADLSQLPAATCRLCALAAERGILEIDEYGGGKGGYGWNWEAAEPPGAHLLATVMAQSWLQRCQVLPGISPVITPDVVTAPTVARATLQWLANLQIWPGIYLLTPQDSTTLAQENPPGHGATGTEHWQWKGAMFRVFCDPLQDTALLTLAIALPPFEALDLQTLILIWKQLAQIAAHEPFAGEELPPSS